MMGTINAGLFLPVVCWLVFAWCSLLARVTVFCNCDVVEAEGSQPLNKSSPQTWLLKYMGFSACQPMLGIIDSKHLPWWSDSLAWFQRFLSLNWLGPTGRCQLTPALVSFCVNTGVTYVCSCWFVNVLDASST